MGNSVLWVPINSSLSCLSARTCLLLQHGSSHRLRSFRKNLLYSGLCTGAISVRNNLLHHGFSAGLNPFKKYPTALAWAPPQAAVWTFILLWSLPLLRLLEHLIPPLLLTPWCLHYYFLLFFSSLSVCVYFTFS